MGQVESDQLCPAFKNPPCSFLLGTALVPWAPQESPEVKFAFPWPPQRGTAGRGQGSGPGPRDSGVLTPGDARGAREWFPAPCCPRRECGRGAQSRGGYRRSRAGLAPQRPSELMSQCGEFGAETRGGHPPPQGTASAKKARRLVRHLLFVFSNGLVERELIYAGYLKRTILRLVQKVT